MLIAIIVIGIIIIFQLSDLGSIQRELNHLCVKFYEVHKTIENIQSDIERIENTMESIDRQILDINLDFSHYVIGPKRNAENRAEETKMWDEMTKMEIGD